MYVQAAGGSLGTLVSITDGSGQVLRHESSRERHYRKFKICRLCFRKLASEGMIPGVRKASW